MRVLLINASSIHEKMPSKLQSLENSNYIKYIRKITKSVVKYLNITDTNYIAYTSTYYANYGLLMLSTLIKKEGYEVKYIAGDWFDTEESFFKECLQEAKYSDILLFSSTTPQFDQVKRLNKYIKTNNINTVSMLGGPHTIIFKYEEFDEEFDFIFSGYDLRKVITVLNSIEKGENFSERFIIGNEYYDCEKDFDIIPNRYINDTILYSYLSFGCPNSCAYCVEHKLSNNRVIQLDIAKKIQEIAILVNKYNIKIVHLADSDFFINSDIAMEFLEQFEKSGVKCCFSINASPTSIAGPNSVNIIKRFVKNGLVELLIGVEHFSETVLQFVNKKYDFVSFYNNLMKVRNDVKELIVTFYTLVGLPGETINTIQENVNKLSEYKKKDLFDFTFPNFFVPFPGTDIYMNPERYGSKILHKEWKHFHRYRVPRNIEINGLTDEDFIQEIKDIYNLGLKIK